MDDLDLRLRALTYGLFVELGRAPTAIEVAGSGDLSRGRRRQRLAAAARAARARARSVHGGDPDGESVLGRADGVPGSGRRSLVVRELRLGRVRDLRGAALDGRIETSCPDCGEALTVEVRAERPDDESLLFHCLVPAARWWDDIVFT